MRKDYNEQYAAVGALMNLSTEPGSIVPLTNTKTFVATLVHLAHNQRRFLLVLCLLIRLRVGCVGRVKCCWLLWWWNGISVYILLGRLFWDPWCDE
jgi:Ni,Fe-hydrogenase I cytochrome b subunit